MLFNSIKIAKAGFGTLLFLGLTCSLFAQKTVTGTVINNSDKQAIPDATVQVKGSKVATVTANDGSFSINAPRDNSVLVITVVGYERIEVPVSGRNTIGQISLNATSVNLNEVVVTGYTSQRKKDITGSVSVVNVNNMKAIPSGTIESLLQ